MSDAHPETLCREVRVTRKNLSAGDHGIYETVEEMHRLIRESIGHPVVRYHAERAVEGIPPGQPLSELWAVYDYVDGLAEYRRDPDEVEYLQAPWWVLQCRADHGRVPQLDCDDLTMLSLSLLGSIGFPTVIRVVSTRPDGEYNHVYGLAQLGDAFVPFDLTKARLTADMPRNPETRGFDTQV